MSATQLTMGLTRASVCLPSGHGLSLTNAAGVVLTAVTGRLWLTMEGDKRDIHIAQGAAYTIERDGLTLGYALEPSVVQVHVPHARPSALQGWAERFWEWLVRVGEVRARARMARGLRML